MRQQHQLHGAVMLAMAIYELQTGHISHLHGKSGKALVECPQMD
jgi:hypothetical protein